MVVPPPPYHAHATKCNLLLQVRSDSEAHIQRLQDQAAAREAQLQADAETQAQELYIRIDGLQQELDSILEFKARQVRTAGYADCQAPTC